MSVIIDLYPMETKSFDALPQDSPLLHLNYGGILTTIFEYVKEERRKNRDERREFLIKKINNINLGVIINDIKIEAKSLKSYRSKQWNKGPVSKANYLKFFESHDISLKYLEDMYELQSKGVPNIKKNSLIKIKGGWNTDAEYGVVVKQISKSTIEYVSVNKDMLPASGVWNGLYISHRSKMNVWKCDVVGKFTNDNWKTLNSVLHKYNHDMKCRTEFWNNHRVLSSLNIPWGYYDRRYDIMNGVLPTYIANYQKPTWDIFKGCIDEKLRLERDFKKLHEQGVLDDEEFKTAMANIITGLYN